MMSTIELKWREREIGGAQTPRRFLDFIIDKKSLYDQVGDMISPLGWLPPEWHQKAVNRFLLDEPPDFPDGRSSIYICPECGDLGCGALSAVIEKVGNQIIWRDFGYENDYDPNIYYGDYSHLGPFTFEIERYTTVIRNAENVNE